ncbi:MAG: ketopantoate reductase family protein [Salinarchaeum sp.]
MDILVFGAGALGSLLGGRLASAHNVTLVGRNPHMQAITEDGLNIVGDQPLRVTPTATTDGEDHQADLAIVAVKAFDTEMAATQLATGAVDIVWSVQNGLGNERTLAEVLPAATVLGGTCTYGATRGAPGTVRAAGNGHLVVGQPDGGMHPAVDRVVTACETAGLSVTGTDAFPRHRWEKLAVNVGINPLTAICDVPNGVIGEPPLRTVTARAARETARVAKACGVPLTTAEAESALFETVETTADNVSSMCQDRRAGRRLEREAITGAVCRRAAANDVAVPTVQTLDALLQVLTDRRYSE